MKQLKVFTCIFIFSTFVACNLSRADENQTMDFETYNPVSTLVVPEHVITRAKFPFIDVHNHQDEMGEGSLKPLVTDMDNLNLQVMINLSGGYGEDLMAKLRNVKKQYPNRFIVFANIDFDDLGNPGWTEREVKRLDDEVKAGVNGLKIFKNLGLSVRDTSGKVVNVDDPRLFAIWEEAGKLHIPVLIHTADPKPFWEPMDDKNERWLELKVHPERRRSDTDPQPWAAMIDQRNKMFAQHPHTTFIAAHLGWYGNDLKRLGKLLDDLPNVNTEFAAVIAELGRQPKAARAFFEKYQDRIMFGKDNWIPEEYRTYFRTLETDDEYFPYHKKYHAFWRMYGMGLPDPILRKIYYKNALRIIPNIDKSLFPKD